MLGRVQNTMHGVNKRVRMKSAVFALLDQKDHFEMTRDEAQLYIDHELEDYKDYKVVEPKTIVDQSRWSTFYTSVLEHIPTKTFWEIGWSRGSTECQDGQDESDNTTVCEVEPVQVTITKYEPKVTK